ncbi:efflux transporter outer membrane subunit [uncultured Parasutterella sp.]|uniref:efflux transporter outer membrane subunit n=1 Tax=uncultured Parasutterella sp. TaxID=1263098 RepID=UPI00272CAB92|nr:efflux transporter outer membrane subunit [uncultured Parasutterella sp.]
MKRRFLILAAAVSSALFLSSCAVGPDYERPAVPVPENFRNIHGQVDASNWLTARWWRQYNDPALDYLVSKAIANNRTLQQTMANVEKAAAQVTVSRSSLFPQLSYSGDGGKARSSMNTVTGAMMDGKAITTYEGLVNASWEIDLWGRIRRQTESAVASYRSAQAAHKAAIASVIGSVVSTYFSILAADEQYRIDVATAESYFETYKLFKLRFQYGNVSEMEVAQARSQWESAMVQIPQIRQNRTELINSLSILTGIAPKAMPQFKKLDELSTPVIAAGIPSDLLTQRPDIIEAEETLKAANADIGAAKALYFPTISLSAGLGYASDELHNLFKSPSHMWSYTGSFTGPIFRWGAVTAGVKSAEAQQKAMLAAYQLAVAQAFADVDNALSSRENAVIELRTKRALVKSLQEYQKLATAQYQGGYTGYVTVLQAEQSLLPQEIQLAEVKARALSSIGQIYQSLGGGWIDQALIEEEQAIKDLEEAEKLKKEQVQAAPETSSSVPLPLRKPDSPEEIPNPEINSDAVPIPVAEPHK